MEARLHPAEPLAGDEIREHVQALLSELELQS
jgi:hypothetical protein